MRAETKFKILELSKGSSLSAKFCLSILLLLALFTLDSCGKKKKSSASVSAPYPSEKMNPNELRDYIESQLESNDLKNFSNRFEDVCPRYDSLDEAGKKEAISAFAVAISDAESSFNSFATFYEEGLGYSSIGLFSLSYEDNKSYGCNFTRNEDKEVSRFEKSIHKTDAQVECFLRITRKILSYPEKDSYLKKISKSDTSAKGNPKLLKITQKLSAYWSVLRSTNKSGNAKYRKSLKEFLPRQCF